MGSYNLNYTQKLANLHMQISDVVCKFSKKFHKLAKRGHSLATVEKTASKSVKWLGDMTNGGMKKNK